MDATSSSKGQSIVSTIENDKVNDLTKEVWSLRKTVVEQQKQIVALKDKQGNINDRLRAQERYTRKDSVLIINPPFDARKNWIDKEIKKETTEKKQLRRKMNEINSEENKLAYKKQSNLVKNLERKKR